MRSMILAALFIAGCGPQATTNATRLWLAPHGSETSLYLSDSEPYPF